MAERIKRGLMLPFAKLGEIGSRYEKLFPYKVIGGEQHLINLKEEMRAGKSAIVTINHFSKRDGLIGPQVAFRFFYPFPGKVVMPLARHNYKEWMGNGLGMFGIEVLPIFDARREIIKKTLEGLSGPERKAEKAKMKAEYAKYITATHEALINSGMLGIAAQSTREPSLGMEPKVAPIQALLDSKQNQDNPIDPNNVLILPVGIGKIGVDDYSGDKIRGYNRGEEFTVRAGPSITLAAAITASESMEYPNVDHVIHDFLRGISPSSYVENE